MNRASSQLAAFHLTGLRPNTAESESGHQGLQPALFSHFRDLTGLRYDFPMILDTERVTGGPVKSLADAIDEALREIAPRGGEGEKTRRQLLRLEQEIRNLLADSQKAPFARTWDKARRKLLASTDKTARLELADMLDKARESICCRGQLVNCDYQFPKALLRHMWAEGRKSGDQALLTRISYLLKKLEDILQLDSLHAGKAHDAGHLESSMGTSDRERFDFQAMSQVLETAPVGEPLQEVRRQRIQDAISELGSQRFVASGPDSSRKPRAIPAFKFEFENCNKAIAAFRKRLPDMAALIKAISIAELEIANRYDEMWHDAYFDDFDQNSLGPDDLALFPTYLVCLVDEPVTAKLKADIMEALGSGLPFKVLAQCDDILGPELNATGQLSFGVRGQQLAGMALGLNKVFVMQAAGSSLYRMREPLLRGLSSRLPALFSVYSGDAIEQGQTVAPYLRAAAATESRAFPCFVLDPERGVGLARRFSLEGNPQVESSWVSHPLQFEDSDRKLMSVDTAFTLVDFIASDVRHAEHFVTIPKSEWTDDMVPVSEFLDLDKEAQAEKIPYTLLLSAGNVLQRAVVDDRLIDAARRCQDSWRGLQELGGINNSHALALLAEAESAWQQERDQLLQQAAQQPLVESGAASTLQQTEENLVDLAVAAEAIAAESTGTAEKTSDDPWIETPRCTTCNECTQLNNRMFAYNDDMQAYIADPAAGTYRELVEAAETCQVAIIHPGKARNPDEPDLEALIARAKPFM